MAEPFHSFAKEIIEAKPICFLEENVLFIVSPEESRGKGRREYASEVFVP